MKYEWLPYPKDRKICHRSNYVVIVPSSYDEGAEQHMPLFCQVCDMRFGHKDDETTYRKFKCCTFCADTWAYSNKEKWELGWRPSQDVIKNIVAKRSFVDPRIVFE